MRNAFSMITAIFVLIIMASISVFVLSYSNKGAKSTTLQYQRAQALLYAKSYTEFAILAVTAHNRTANCVKSIEDTIGNINQGGYRIRTYISYIGPITEIGTCPSSRRLSTNVTTTDTPLTLIIDSYVSYKDPDNTSQTSTVHLRTVQKI